MCHAGQLHIIVITNYFRGQQLNRSEVLKKAVSNGHIGLQQAKRIHGRHLRKCVLAGVVERRNGGSQGT